MNVILEKAKGIGKGITSAMIKPFLEKQHSRITWQAYGKWRTFTNINGRVIFRRYGRQPKGAKAVRNAREATEKAQELWGLEVDSRGRLPVAPPKLPIATPILRQPVYLGSRSFYPITRRPPRITPPRPRLSR